MFNQRSIKPEIETTMTKTVRKNDLASVTDLAAVRRAKFPQTAATKTRLQWMFSSVRYNQTPCQIIPFPGKRVLVSGSK